MKETTQKGTALILLVLVIGTFMSALDTSAITVAVPTIQNDFGVSLAAVEWVITAYLLVISSLLLTFGRLADMRGHKTIYTTGFAIFTTCSLLCGFSTGIYPLIACRIAQALGAAMMFSSSSAIITANIPTNRRGKAFGITAVAVASACCIGPVAGGMLAGTLGWRSIFFINVPTGIIGTFLAARFIPADKPKPAQRFDFPGALLVFFALFLLLLPLDLSASGGFPPLMFAGLLASGCIFAALFVLREMNTRQPMLNPGLFRNRIFSASLTAAIFNYAAQFMMAFLAPYYFQKIRLLSPVMTGLLYLPMPLATILVAPLSGSFSDRHDSRIISSAGMGIMAVGMALLAFLDVETPYWYIILGMALAGTGSGMFQSPNNSAIMGCAPPEHRGAASGTLATVRNIGMVLGVALSGAIFNAGTGHASKLHFSNHIAATYGLRITFLAAAGAAMMAMCSSLVKGKTRQLNTDRAPAIR